MSSVGKEIADEIVDRDGKYCPSDPQVVCILAYHPKIAPQKTSYKLIYKNLGAPPSAQIRGLVQSPYVCFPWLYWKWDRYDDLGLDEFPTEDQSVLEDVH
jgi:hypothetical protein